MHAPISTANVDTAAMSSRSSVRGTLAQKGTGVPLDTTPCTGKKFFAGLIAMVTMKSMVFPFLQTGELMRDRHSHRGPWMPYPASARFTWDGEVAFIP
jgi:hypothetical protein